MNEQLRFLGRFSLIFSMAYVVWKLWLERIYLQGLILAFVALLPLLGHRGVRVGDAEQKPLESPRPGPSLHLPSESQRGDRMGGRVLITYRGLDRRVDLGLVAMSLLPWTAIVIAAPKLGWKEKAIYGLSSAAGIFALQVACLVLYVYAHHLGHPWANFLEVFFSSVILMALPFIGWWAFMISPPSSRPVTTSRARRRRSR